MVINMVIYLKYGLIKHFMKISRNINRFVIVEQMNKALKFNWVNQGDTLGAQIIINIKENDLPHKIVTLDLNEIDAGLKGIRKKLGIKKTRDDDRVGITLMDDNLYGVYHNREFIAGYHDDKLHRSPKKYIQTLENINSKVDNHPERTRVFTPSNSFAVFLKLVEAILKIIPIQKDINGSVHFSIAQKDEMHCDFELNDTDIIPSLRIKGVVPVERGGTSWDVHANLLKYVPGLWPNINIVPEKVQIDIVPYSFKVGKILLNPTTTRIKIIFGDENLTMHIYIANLIRE